MTTTVTGYHLENCQGATADKQYRVYALDLRLVITSYGARGGQSQPGPAEFATPATIDAVLQRTLRARNRKGYVKVATLTFTTPSTSPTVPELDAAFDDVWEGRSRKTITALTEARKAPGSERCLASLPRWQSPRGRGGHRQGRPWGAGLADVLTNAPTHYAATTRTTFAVVPAAVGPWLLAHYPGAGTAPVPADVDGAALVTLVPQMLATGAFADLSEATAHAVAALS